MTEIGPQQLRASGLRVTAPRLAVMQALATHPHGDAELIATTARENLGSLSTQAVYDILRALTGAGLARRIEPAGHPARYETRVGDNHHHIVCRQCGSTQDANCVVGAAPCMAPDDDAGYSIDEAEVVFWGVCPSCQRAARDTTAGSATSLPQA